MKLSKLGYIVDKRLNDENFQTKQKLMGRIITYQIDFQKQSITTDERLGEAENKINTLDNSLKFKYCGRYSGYNDHSGQTTCKFDKV